MPARCRSFIALAVLLLGFKPPVAFSCTTFVYRSGNHILFGRNLDWICGTGLMMTNARGLEKEALPQAGEKPMKWISKYGSLTFNQVGKELPYGGINEAGLVVEQMTLNETRYPPKDSRPVLGALQWIQWQLDAHATVSEVIQSCKSARIADAQNKYHFLVCDRKGDAAAIEFIGGEAVIHSGKDLPVAALANSPYEDSLRNFNNPPADQPDLSLVNFATAGKGIQAPGSPSSPVDAAFDILKAVSQGLSTKWSIVYDLTAMKAYVKIFETPVIEGERKIFRKKPGEAATKIVDVKAFDYSPEKPGQAMDLEAEIEGEANAKFADYTTEINRKSIAKAFKFFQDWGGTGIALSDQDIAALAKYPEEFKVAKIR